VDETLELYILWTNADPITAEKMVFMYALNSLKYGWWENVTLIIWGATAKLVAENEQMQQGIRTLLGAEVKVSACRACAEQLGVAETLGSLGVEVKYWGEGLTQVLRSKATLLTI
jgi:hypothetical protein